MTRHTAPVTTIDPPEPGPPTTPQHPLAVSIVLHLLPGAALVTFVLVTAPVVRSLGLPPLFAMFAGIGLVIAPLELGYLAVQARRTTGSWSPLAEFVQFLRHGYGA